MMGTERRSMVITEEEKKVTAYHEAGHALVAMYIPSRRPGAQGIDHPARPGHGVTMYLPPKRNTTRPATGSTSASAPCWRSGRRRADLQQRDQRRGQRSGTRTMIARKMVCEWG